MEGRVCVHPWLRLRLVALGGLHGFEPLTDRRERKLVELAQRSRKLARKPRHGRSWIRLDERIFGTRSFTQEAEH